MTEKKSNKWFGRSPFELIVFIIAVATLVALLWFGLTGCSRQDTGLCDLPKIRVAEDQRYFAADIRKYLIENHNYYEWREMDGRYVAINHDDLYAFHRALVFTLSPSYNFQSELRDCDNYAELLRAFVPFMVTSRMDAQPLIATVIVLQQPYGSHAMVAALTDKGLVLIEPQDDGQWRLVRKGETILNIIL